MTSTELASRIDHTLLKPEALPAEIHQLAVEAMEHRFASVCIAPVWVAKVIPMLRGSGVKVCTVAGFPQGTSKPTIKAIETTSSVKEGVDEVDVVAHLPNLIVGDLYAAKAELMELVRAARAARRDVLIKVIVESAVLMALGGERAERAIATACRAVRESGCDFIKTSTGFHPAGGASVEAVKLMKRYGEGICIKASGGIRDWPTARAMLDAGADRLGLSASAEVMKQFEAAG